MDIIYHLRITTTPRGKNLDKNASRKYAQDLWQAFKVRFAPKKYLVFYERSEKGVPHLHCRVIYAIKPAKQSLSSFFANLNLSGKYHHEIERDKLKNELYIAKDGDFVDSNYTNEELEDIYKNLEAINNDKLKKARHKLYDIIFLDYDYIVAIMDKHKKYEFIINRIKEIHILDWDKLPPPYDLARRYAEYILGKMFKKLV